MEEALEAMTVFPPFYKSSERSNSQRSKTMKMLGRESVIAQCLRYEKTLH